MQFHFFSPSDVTTNLQTLLKDVEGFRPKAYWDTADPPKATIGLGFNIQDVRDYLKLVLQEVYGLTGQTVAKFITNFDNGISKIQPLSKIQTRADQNLFNGQLQSLLDHLAFQDLGRGPFTISESQANAVERRILEGYSIDGIVKGTIGVASCNHTL